MKDLTRKTQNPVQEGGAAAKGGAAGLGSSRNCWKLVSMRKSFQDKKPGRSSGFGRGFGSLQGQSHKPSAFFCSTSSPQALPGCCFPGGNCGAASRVGTATSRSLSAAGYTCTHKQGRSQLAAWQPQHTWQGSECPAGLRDPSLCLFPTRRGQFWLCWSLGPVEKSQCQ